MCVMRKMYRQHLGPSFSEGARLTWIKLIRDDGEIEDVNRVIGKSRGRAHRILYGDRPVSIPEAEAIRVAFGVPIQAWGRRPARPFKTPAERAAA